MSEDQGRMKPVLEELEDLREENGLLKDTIDDYKYEISQYQKLLEGLQEVNDELRDIIRDNTNTIDKARREIDDVVRTIESVVTSFGRHT